MTKPTRGSKTAVTRAELCEAIYKKVGLSRSGSDQVGGNCARGNYPLP